MNNKQFKDYVLNSVRLVFDSLSPGEELLPLFLLYTGKEVALIPVSNFMDSAESKDIMIEEVRKVCTSKGITMLAFVTEVWKAHLKDDKDYPANGLAEYQGEKTVQAMVRMEFAGFEPEVYFAEINRDVSPPKMEDFTKMALRAEGRLAPPLLPQNGFPV